MKAFPLLLTLMLSHKLFAVEEISSFPWQALIQSTGKISHQEQIIRINADRKIKLPLFEWATTEIEEKKWAITGKIRYADVIKNGYLEMWSELDDGSRFFSRTMAEDGPMARIYGSHDWRSFWLPANALGSSAALKKIEINIILPDGWAEIKDLRFFKLDVHEDFSLLYDPGQAMEIPAVSELQYSSNEKNDASAESGSFHIALNANIAFALIFIAIWLIIERKKNDVESHIIAAIFRALQFFSTGSFSVCIILAIVYFDLPALIISLAATIIFVTIFTLRKHQVTQHIREHELQRMNAKDHVSA